MQSSPPWCSLARLSPARAVPACPPFDVVVRPPCPPTYPSGFSRAAPQARAEGGNDPIAALYVCARHSVACMYACMYLCVM